MRILFLATYYRPHWSGLTIHMGTVAEGMAKRGHEVTVVTTQHQKNLSKVEVVEGVKVVRTPSLFRFSRTQFSPTFIWTSFVEMVKAQSVVIFIPMAECLLIVLLAKLLKKRVYLVHNGDYLPPRGIINKTVLALYHLTTSMALCLVNAVAVQSEDYSNWSKLLSPFKNKWAVIPTPVRKYPVVNRVLTNLRKMIPSKSRFVVGFGGRFTEEKGFDLLLESVDKIVKEIPGSHFVFAGETKMVYENFYEKHQGLVNKTKNHVTYLGVLNRHEIFNYYPLCDVFVISSLADCFPNMELEALLSGVPVVVTDIPGARWPVAKTGMGEIVGRNSNELAKGVIKVYLDKKKYLKHMKKVEAYLDYEKSISELELLFTQ